MSGLNRAQLLGNIGKDPEVKKLDSGKAVAQFTIATNETYKDKSGEKVSKTEWHNIVMWSPLAEVAEKYFKKGMQIYIEGKISTRSYETEGTTKYRTEIVANNFTFCGGNNNQQATQVGDQELPTDGVNDLPF